MTVLAWKCCTVKCVNSNDVYSGTFKVIVVSLYVQWCTYSGIFICTMKWEVNPLWSILYDDAYYDEDMTYYDALLYTMKMMLPYDDDVAYLVLWWCCWFIPADTLEDEVSLLIHTLWWCILSLHYDEHSMMMMNAMMMKSYAPWWTIHDVDAWLP